MSAPCLCWLLIGPQHATIGQLLLYGSVDISLNPYRQHCDLIALCPFVIMMHECSHHEQLPGTALVHLATLTGFIHICCNRLGMMYKCIARLACIEASRWQMNMKLHAVLKVFLITGSTIIASSILGTSPHAISLVVTVSDWLVIPAVCYREWTGSTIIWYI